MNKSDGFIRPVISPRPEAEAGEIDLVALSVTIWNGKWRIAVAAVTALAIGFCYAFILATPMYTSTAVIALEAQEQRVITDIESVLSGNLGDKSAVNTETVVLTSRGLVGRLVDTMGLVSDPEFNSTLKERSPLAPGVLIGNLARLVTGREPALLTETEIRNQVIDAVIEALSVNNQRDSLAFNISFVTESPEKSALLANKLAELYIRNQLEVKFLANERASEFLSERAAELKLALESQERNLGSFREQAKLVNPENLEARARQLKDMRERIQMQGGALAKARADAEALRALRSAGDHEGIARATGDPILGRALAGANRGTIDRATLDQLADTAIARADAAVQRQADQLSSLEVSERQLAAEFEQQSGELIALQQMERETEATRLLYESFLTRLKETNVQRGLQQSDSRLLSEAVPRPPSAPKKGLVLALSMVLGLMVGIGWVLLREMGHNTFRTADDLRAATDATVMGVIPIVPGKHRQDIITYLRDKPTSIVSEAVRNLRTSLLMSNIDHPPQVIMITSSVPGEGKTTLSLALALNMNALGKRVLLIEGDIRRLTFAKYFDVRETHSLIEAMTDPAILDRHEALSDDNLGVDILTGTKVAVNAADLFASQSFADLIAAARTSYDYILIDTPPVLVVPDARVIGQHADAILYIVRWDKTTRTQVAEGMGMFGSVGLRVAGVALSQIDPTGMRRYGYGGQYGYDSYGSKYYDA